MTISVLQQVSDSLLTTATTAVTLTGVTAGSTIAVFGTCENTQTMTCADNVNGSYGAAVDSIDDAVNTQTVASFKFQNSAAGTIVVTITFSASINFTGIWAFEIGGAATASFDGHNGQVQQTPTTGTDAVTSGTITPTAQPGLIVAVSSDTTGGAAPAAGTGFTDHGTGWGNAGPTRAESKRYTATSAIGGTFTGTNVAHTTLAMAFKEATGSGVTVGLTGQSATATAGTLTQSRTVALTGQNATFAAGNVSAGNNVTVSLTGQSAAFASGTLGPSRTVSLVGQAAAFAAGNISIFALQVGRPIVTGPGISPDYRMMFTPRPLSSALPATNVTVALTGQSATFTAGSVAPSSSKALAGSAITSATGLVLPARSIALTGTAATSAAGTLSAGSQLTVTGQAAIFAPGAMAVSLQLALTGQGASFAPGTVTAPGGVTVSLTGQSAAFATGALQPSSQRALAGQGATFAAGTVTAPANVTVALTGQASSFAVGALAPSSSAVLAGSVITSQTGQLLSARTLAFQGVQATFATGIVLAPGSVTVSLTGTRATFRTGIVTALGAYLTGGPRYVLKRLRARRFTVSAMSYSEFEPIDPSEAVKLTFDFSPDLPTGVTLTGTPTVTVVADEGTDASPNSILNGIAGFNLTATQVIVPVKGGPAASYDIKVVSATSDAQTVLALTGTLPVVAGA